MVFSAEHYAEVVHNWVRWAAPVFDPVTGRPLGVIDLSTTWDRTHPIGLATARVMARLIEGALPADRRTTPLGSAAPADPGLTLTLLGTAEVWFDGQRLLLNRRQTEILALLALHPGGLWSSTCTPCSTATPRSPRRRSRPRCPTCARRSPASSPRGPTD